MKSENFKVRTVIAIGSIALASMGSFPMAQAATRTGSAESGQAANSGSPNEDAKDAAQQLNKAATVVKQMNRNASVKSMLQQAQGVFIIPDYGRAALGVGGRGGEGVLMVKQQNGQWASSPAFYNIGGVSLGLQAGVEAGELAFILNNQKAVDSFKQQNNWSLNADAGLTIVNWSPKAQGSAGKGDVVVWANTKGLFGDAAVSVTDINYDEKEVNAFYGKQVSIQDIFNGNVTAPARKVAALTRVLPRGSGSTSVGSSSSPSAQGTSSGSSGASESQGTSGGSSASGTNQK